MNKTRLITISLIAVLVLSTIGIFISPALASKERLFSFEQKSRNNLLPDDREAVGYGIERDFSKKTGNATQRNTTDTKTRPIDVKRITTQMSKSYVEDEILVKYKKNQINLKTTQGRAMAENLARTKSMEKEEDLRNLNISVLKIKDGKTIEEKIAELKKDPNVEYAEPNYKRYPTAINSNDTYKNLLWGLDNVGQEVNGITGTNDADIDAPRLGQYQRVIVMLLWQ